jgi:hypothetical protein
VHKKNLTKDNLAKRNWKGSLDCAFCGLPESIDHLFFQCLVARFIWRIVQSALGLISIPNSADDLFGTWINSFNKTEKIWFCLDVELSSGRYGVLAMTIALMLI